MVEKVPRRWRYTSSNDLADCRPGWTSDIRIILFAKSMHWTRWKVVRESTTSRESRTASEAKKLFRLPPTYLVWPSVNSPVSACRNSPWPLLPHPSTDRSETRTWSSRSPRNLPIKFGTNPSTIVLVIVVTDRQTDRQTHTHTNQWPVLHS